VKTINALRKEYLILMANFVDYAKKFCGLRKKNYVYCCGVWTNLTFSGKTSEYLPPGAK